MIVEKTFAIDAPPDKVMNAMRDPALIEKSEKSRDALSVNVQDVRRDDKAHVYKIFIESYARSLTGIDRSKIEKSMTEVTWDVEKRSGRWVWNGSHGPRVKISGGYDVLPDRNGASLKMKVDIDISIPVVGKMIAKKVEEGFLTEWPRYVGRVAEHAKNS